MRFALRGEQRVEFGHALVGFHRASCWRDRNPSE